jgi:hypothetical protein
MSKENRSCVTDVNLDGQTDSKNTFHRSKTVSSRYLSSIFANLFLRQKILELEKRSQTPTWWAFVCLSGEKESNDGVEWLPMKAATKNSKNIANFFRFSFVWWQLLGVIFTRAEKNDQKPPIKDDVDFAKFLVHRVVRTDSDRRKFWRVESSSRDCLACETCKSHWIGVFWIHSCGEVKWMWCVQ